MHTTVAVGPLVEMLLGLVSYQRARLDELRRQVQDYEDRLAVIRAAFDAAERFHIAPEVRPLRAMASVALNGGDAAVVTLPDRRRSELASSAVAASGLS